MSDNTFCTDCGTALPEGAGFCASCGTSTTAAPAAAQVAAPAAPQASYAAPPSSAAQLPVEPKSKSTAVWLNVLFGFFGYLYTYKTDKVRFWIFLAILAFNLAVGILPFVWWVIWLAPTIVAATRSRAWYANFPNNVR